MKQNKLIFVLLFVVITNIQSQTLSNETKWKLIGKIDNNTPDYILDSLRIFKVIEAIPKIRQYFWFQDEYNRSNFLELLYDLADPNIIPLIHTFIDSIKVNENNETNRFSRDFSSLMRAFTIMFSSNDYSRFEYFNKFLSNIEEMINITPILKPIELLANNSQYKHFIKPYFEKCLIKSFPASIKSLFIRKYYQLFPDTNYILAKQIASNDALVEVRYSTILFLKQINSLKLVPFLKDRVERETDLFIKEMILYQLLQIFQSPSNLYFIKEKYDSLNLELKESLSKSGFLENKLVYPSIYLPNILLDSLKSYTKQCNSLNWLQDDIFSIDLIQKIEAAQNFLQVKDSIACYKQIKSFQTSIQQVYQDSAGSYPKYVSKDAYKFLYYYPQYILERLPSPPTVKLEDSQGKLLPDGSLQYYEGGWKTATNNGDGTFYLDTKLKTVSLRMTYEYGSQTKNNVTVGKDAIIFQTVNTKVKLFSSEGAPLDTGTVQYYAGGWRNLGKTTNGVATKELLAGNYSFRMTYAYASTDKSQNLDTNSTVVFTTKNTIVELRNSEGQLIDGGEVQYYSGGWRQFGTISGGISQKELLPNTYSFRITYGYGSNDKQQNTGTNPIVVFYTVKANVELIDSRNNLLDQGVVQYYSGAWRDFGTTINGEVTKELLPNNYSFRMNYAFASNDKQQNIGTNPTVVFQTVNTSVELRNSQNNLMGEGTVQYYSGGWRSIGTTAGGQVSRELLPNNYFFRMTHEYISLDKAQNIGTSNVVTFNTLLCRVRVRDNQNQPINNATVRYYAGAWRNIGITINGEVTKELLPSSLTFRAIVGTQQQDKTQNLLTNPVVEFTF